MPRPCQHQDQPQPQTCRLCWLYLNQPDYRALWDSPGYPALSAAAHPAGRALPCRHRGDAVREEQCPTCQGQVRVKVFACALHAECTIAGSVASLACCARCPDYHAATAERPAGQPPPPGC